MLYRENGDFHFNSNDARFPIPTESLESQPQGTSCQTDFKIDCLQGTGEWHSTSGAGARDKTKGFLHNLIIYPINGLIKIIIRL